MGWYARVMTRYPYIFILMDTILALVCGPVTVWKYGFPDFSDPFKGFEPRGSYIHGAALASDHIHDAIADGVFTSYPRKQSGNEHVSQAPPEYDFNTTQNTSDLTTVWSPTISSLTLSTDKNDPSSLTPNTDPDQSHSRQKRRPDSAMIELQECAESALSLIDINSPRFVITSSDMNRNLFHVDKLKAICAFERKYFANYRPERTCNLYSLPMFVSALQQKSCDMLTADDVTEVLDVIKSCAPLFFSGTLTPYCDVYRTCPGVPSQCTRFNTVYIILQILTNTEFMKEDDTDVGPVDYSLLIIPPTWEPHKDIADFFYEELDGKTLEHQGIKIVAMRLDIDDEVLSSYLIGDLPWYGLAMALVILTLLFYLQSFIMTIVFILNIMFTVSICYFLYYYVCRMVFFPFMNLFAVLLLIAIGADDVFVLYDIWRQQLRNNPNADLEDIMSSTLKHAAVSIFVTSLTTAAALLANLVSSITSIRCFGIFAALCMGVTFFLMITLVPAVVVIAEKLTAKFCSSKCLRFQECLSKAAKFADIIWEKTVPKIVIKGNTLWVIVLVAVGIGGLVVVFHKPGLSLPSSNHLSLFVDDHPFEQYRNVHRKKFRFELALEDALTEGGLKFQIVWGALPSDNGNWFDPDDTGRLVMDSLDIFTPEEQLWMKDFCVDLKEQGFLTDDPGTCFMDLFQTIVEGPCTHNSSLIDLEPCCEQTFPLNATDAKYCMHHIPHISHVNYTIFDANISSLIGKPLFNQNGELGLFIIDFKSNVHWTPSHSTMQELYNQISDFIKDSKQSAPKSLQRGWFAGRYGWELELFDLQLSLSTGTFLGMLASLLVAFVVLLSTSLNIVLTVYAIVTIALVISSTCGTLVLLGWELNVFESIIITLSIGLAVDFTIHYGVAYKLSNAITRTGRVTSSLATVGSAVTMAALTTFMSGAAVMPGRVLSYQQFGTFLMIIMSYSWVFSTFLFLPLCSMIGPLKHTGDIAYFFRFVPCIRRRRKKYSLEQQMTAMDSDSGSAAPVAVMALRDVSVSISSSVEGVSEAHTGNISKQIT